MASLVKLPQSIQRKQKVDAIKQQIINQVKSVQKFSTPTGIDIIHFVCLLAENLLTKDLEVITSDFVISIFQTLYPSLTEAELQQIESDINHLKSLGLIKKVPILIRALNYAYQIAQSLLFKKA